MTGYRSCTCAREHPLQQRAGAGASLAGGCQRQRDGRAHNEQEAGHHQVRKVKPVPRSMREPARLMARMVHKQHQCHCAATCNVKALEPAHRQATQLAEQSMTQIMGTSSAFVGQGFTIEEKQARWALLVC